MWHLLDVLVVGNGLCKLFSDDEVLERHPSCLNISVGTFNLLLSSVRCPQIEEMTSSLGFPERIVSRAYSQVCLERSDQSLRTMSSPFTSLTNTGGVFGFNII